MAQTNLINILQSLDTPCFIFDESDFINGIHEFSRALATRFNNFSIGYSVKTNSLPYALLLSGNLGCKAEVVSEDEYQLARLCGFDNNNIIYNGPMKSKRSFLDMIIGGGTVNIETKRELEWLSDVPKDKIYNIGLRLNINISNISLEDADGEDDNSRFGFSDESNEFFEAIKFIGSFPNIKLSGLHIHRTAHSRSPRFYGKSVEYAAKIIKKYNLSLDYLDVGGGYFGIFPNKPTFNDYADAIYKPLASANLQNLRIIIEPGNALTASAFKFLSEVIDIKTVDACTRFITTDGSRNDIDPFFKKTDYLKEILYSSEERPIEPFQIVSGCSCLEYDRLFELINKPRLEIGDKILYNNVGAYTMTLSPQFIRLWPKVYAINDKGMCKLVSRKSNAQDIMNLNI